MDNINQSTDFRIVKLSIVASNGYGKDYDLRNVFIELNIYDTVLFSSVSGNIIINDAAGLINDLSLDGSEVLLVRIGKSENDITYTNKFRIYKIGNRQPLSATSEAYSLHFVSDEYILSAQRKISQSYVGTYSNIAIAIMKDKLLLKPETISATPSIGIKNVVVPNLSPIESLEWLARRAVDNDSVPNFLFFENKTGYNFVSLSDMIRSSEVARINIDPKNLGKTFFEKKNETELGNEFLGAREFKTTSQFDFLKSVKSGSYAGTFLGFDPITRSFDKQKFNYSSYYGKNPVHQSKVPNLPLVYDTEGKLNIENYESRKIMYPFALYRSNSEYIKKNGGAFEKNIEDNPHEYMLQRPAILRSFFNKTVKLVMPGNFNLSAGYNVLIKVPDRGVVYGEENRDDSLYGRYTIISTRHKITFSKHETIFEACTDSTNNVSFKLPSTAQNQALSSTFTI